VSLFPTTVSARQTKLLKFCGYTFPDQDVVDWFKRAYNTTKEYTVASSMALLAEHVEMAYRIPVKMWGTMDEPFIVILSRRPTRDPSATLEDFTPFKEEIGDRRVKRTLELEGFRI
jgi:hypothetical protein